LRRGPDFCRFGQGGANEKELGEAKRLAEQLVYLPLVRYLIRVREGKAVAVKAARRVVGYFKWNRCRQGKWDRAIGISALRKEENN
jgi:hypothetical protein